MAQLMYKTVKYTVHMERHLELLAARLRDPPHGSPQPGGDPRGQAQCQDKQEARLDSSRIVIARAVRALEGAADLADVEAEQGVRSVERVVVECCKHMKHIYR